MQRREIDLAALARSLERKREHPELVKKIKQTISVASAHQDLRMAKDALTELRALTGEGRKGDVPAERRGTIGGALFAHAILLYTRATETKPIDRWKWFGRDMLTEGQRHWHKQIMDYRDKVLAHFGHGLAQSGGPEVRIALVMREPVRGDSTVEVAFLESRANTRASLSAKLDILLDVTIDLARRGFDTRLGEMHHELHTATQKNELLGSLAQAHPFDRASFLDGAKDIDLIGSGEKSHHYFKEGRRVTD